MEIRAVIGAGLSASAFSNSVSMLIAVLGLSGHCNSCRATGAVICNSRGCRIVGQSHSCNSCIAGSATRVVIVGSAARGPATRQASLSSHQASTIVALAECMWLNCKRGCRGNGKSGSRGCCKSGCEGGCRGNCKSGCKGGSRGSCKEQVILRLIGSR